MTWQNPPPLQPRAKTASKPVTPEQLARSGSEDANQMALFAWAALNVGKYPSLKYMFAIPNGGSRHIAEATKMVATGLRKGVPDIFLPAAKLNKWFMLGLFIEMKVDRNKTSDEQKEYIKYLMEAGYYCAVCYSWQKARDVIVDYLEGRL